MCEITTYRADRYDRVSRNPDVVYGESLEDDLRRRDFTINAMALSVTGAPTFSDPFGGLADLVKLVLRDAGPPGGVVRRRSAAHAARRPLRVAARRAGRAGCRGRAARDGRAAGADHRRARAGRADQAACSAPTRGPASKCSSTPGWPTSCCPSCPRCGWPPTSTASTRTCTPTPCRCSSRRSTSRTTGRTSCCAGPRCCMTSASRPPARSCRVGGSASITTRRSDGTWPASGCARCATASTSSTTSPSSSSCICASTATATATGPTRRCAATSSTPASCCLACTSSSAPTARRATAARPPRCRPRTTGWRSASPTCRSRRSSSGSVPISTATRS